MKHAINSLHRFIHIRHIADIAFHILRVFLDAFFFSARAEIIQHADFMPVFQ